MLRLSHSLQTSILTLIGRVRYHFLDRHHIQTVRVGLIILGIVAGVGVSVLFTLHNMIGIAALGGVAALGVFLVAYHKMELFTSAILVISTVINLGVGTGTETQISFTLLIIMFLFALWVVRLLIVDRSFSSVRESPLNWPVLAWSVVVVISLFWGSYYVEEPVRALLNDRLMPRIMSTLVMIISPFAALIVLNYTRSFNQIRFFVWWFIGYGAVAAVFQLVASIGGPQPPFFMNMFGQLPAWVAILALGQFFYNDNLSQPMRIALLGITGLWTYIQYGLGISWISGWFPVFMGVGIVVFLSSRKLFILVVLAGLVYLAMNMDFVEALFAEEAAESGDTRLEAWNTTLEIIAHHFLFGMGPVGYFFYLTAYIGGFFQLSHNTYVDMLAQTGIIGFVIYLWLWGSIGWLTLKTYLIAPARGFRKGLATSLMAVWPVTMVVMLLGDWVIPFPYTQSLNGISYTIWPWLLAGITGALYHEMRHNPNLHADENDPSSATPTESLSS